MKLKKPEEAIPHYERSLSLIDVATEKPRLLNDSAKAYSAAASRSGNDAAAWRARSEDLFQQAVQLDPKYSNAYRDWLASNLIHEEYSKAWAVVKKLGRQAFKIFRKSLSIRLAKRCLNLASRSQSVEVVETADLGHDQDLA